MEGMWSGLSKRMKMRVEMEMKKISELDYIK
jgi:hypothetical protein